MYAGNNLTRKFGKISNDPNKRVIVKHPQEKNPEPTSGISYVDIRRDQIRH